MLRFLTAGESHGPSLVGIVEGLPAGLAISIEAIDRDLARRQVGYGAGARMKIEHDHVEILGGLVSGETIGAPVALQIENLDYKNWKDRPVPVQTIPRPGHADLAGAAKYDFDNLRLVAERASARETATRVAAGSLARQLLAQFGITVGSYVTEIGGEVADLPDRPYSERFTAAEASDVRVYDEASAERIRQRIREVMLAKDTAGGVIEIVALNVPVGLGSHVHWDRKLDGRLAQAVMSIHSVKGVEIGPAFENSRRLGTQVQDEIVLDPPSPPLAKGGEVVAPPLTKRGDLDPSHANAEGGRVESSPPLTKGGQGGVHLTTAGHVGVQVRRLTNRAGGLEGGITNGEPLVIRAALKPISTTLTPLRSIDLATGQPALAEYQRSDLVHIPRACVIGEAMVAWVLADALMEKIGGDSLREMRAHFESWKIQAPLLSEERQGGVSG